MHTLLVITDSKVTMVTFGGKQVWTAHAGEVFSFNGVVERNASYVVVYSGLNHYIFEAHAVQF